MKIALIIASKGRAELLAPVFARWAVQSRTLDATILSVSSEADLPNGPLPLPVTVVKGVAGLCAQRNRALDTLRSFEPDVVIFADDDYVPAVGFVAGVERVFQSQPDVAVATGWVLADGARGDAVSFASAERLIAEYNRIPVVDPEVADTTGGYGCNMAVRWLLDRSIRFDERLALYGWQEDIDFTRSYRNRGRIVYTRAFAGVHIGYQGARVPGRRLGFSQVINPVYLILKGTMPFGFGANLMLRNVLANIKGAVLGDEAVDRVGRLKGNLLGFRHLFTGRVTPEQVIAL